MILYMEITKDEYELPVAVADSMAELARLTDGRLSSISHCLNRPKKRRCKYITVEVDDEGLCNLQEKSR